MLPTPSKAKLGTIAPREARLGKRRGLKPGGEERTESWCSISELGQLSHRALEIISLGKDGIFQHWLISNKGVFRGHSADGSIERFKQLIGDAGRDFRAVSPAQGIFVGDQHAIRLPNRPGN